MRNENEQPTNAWDDEDETGTTLRGPYPNAADQNRPQPRPGVGSQNASQTPGMPGGSPRPRGVPGSADYYEEIEGDKQSVRPRPRRQSREEVEARLRQRSRPSNSAREQAEPGTKSISQTRKQLPRTSQQRAAEEAGYGDQQPTPARQPRPTRDFPSSAPARPTRDFASRNPVQRAAEPHDEYNDNEYALSEERRHRPEHKQRRKSERRVFSTLLTGCLGGLIALIVVAGVILFFVLHNTPLGQNLGVSKATVNQPSQAQTLALGSATQLIIKDQAGNISVNVDQNASAATLTSVRHVQASSQSDADNQFKQIVLSATPIAQGTDPACLVSSCLLISATTPATTSGGIFGGSNGDSIDLTITLPPSFNSPNISAPNIITASDKAGDINVSGFNGVLNLNGSAGNIAIAHTLIFASTCIQTLHGNITIAQESIFNLASPSPLIPCSNTTSSDPQRPWFNIHSGVGNVDITLTTNLNNLLLDANTNKGQITDDFNLNITSSDGSDTYHGPIVPNTSPTAALYIIASTGNIALHKQP